jgi:regulator of extracellular matrix RemA (YlzA/DUF370 family)
MEPAEGYTTDFQSNETVDLDFCDVRAQERRSTIVSPESNPLNARASHDGERSSEIKVCCVLCVD